MLVGFLGLVLPGHPADACLWRVVLNLTCWPGRQALLFGGTPPVGQIVT